jgi:hypothetical protein
MPVKREKTTSDVTQYSFPYFSNVPTYYKKLTLYIFIFYDSAEAERMTALKNALICTILASAGIVFHTTRNSLCPTFDITFEKAEM